MDKRIIKEKLDLYLEFDSDKLFCKRNDLSVIFGGAIRDIVSGTSIDDINDIDIMGLPKSLEFISFILNDNGYEKINLVRPDVFELYKDMHCIFFPTTFKNKNDKIVQLIRPRYNFMINNIIKQYDNITQSFINLLSNVDLTSSGLFYDGYNLYESIPNSYVHCKLKIFEEVKDAIMFNNIRTMLRSNKLEMKKWKKVKNIDNKVLNRTIKIFKIKNYNIKSIEDYKNIKL